ncbi:hypothetical protein [Prosthecobacter sp.]|uniref:hypothetical protein n=1 Tax=Prosthecobacter sp. TaxID=1965333 RepID=UPI001E1ABFEB|nr:hypothetical protein [Prosthecobacter sp.]MCB1276357.1 hypothetical protein [Prosthecobacter sp.]
MKDERKTVHHLSMLLLVLFGLALPVDGEDFRFRCMGETTGLCDFLRDAAGKETTIKISPDSDPGCLVLFKALQTKRVYGTKGWENHEGAKWKQEIILTGVFLSPLKWTESGPNTAPSEQYRDFKITGLKVQFPLSRFVDATDDPTGPVIMETHFGFDSLFPQGLRLSGKLIDLGKHTAKKSDAE